MEWSSIRDAVTGTWDFVYPPVINLVILALLWYPLIREDLGLAAVRAGNRLAPYLTNLKIRRNLKLFGLDKIGVVATIFCIVFTLYATSRSVGMIGHLLPGNVSYRPTDLAIHSGRAKLVGLWARHPRAPALLDLVNTLNASASARAKEIGTALENAEHWEQEYALNVARFDFTKFYLFSVLVLFIARRARGFPVRPLAARYTLVVIALCGCLVWFTAMQVRAIEQIGFARLNAWIVADALTVDSAGEPDDQSVSARLDSEDDSSNWWTFKILDTTQATWLWRTLAH